MTRRQDISDAVRLDRGWRAATVAMQRDTGDAIVSVEGWTFSLEGGGTLGGTVRMSLRRYQRASLPVSEADPKDGEVFESSEHAQAYALNRGALKWYSEFAGAKLVAAAGEMARLMDEMCLRVERDSELGQILATGYPFASSLDELSCQVTAWRDAMDAAMRQERAPRTHRPTEPEVCPLCLKPAHPNETDDHGKHPECAAKERGIVP